MTTLDEPGTLSGFAPTGNSARDTAALQLAHDRLPATGGDIPLRAGVYAISTAGLNFTKPVRLHGVGPSGGPLSTAGGYTVDASLTTLTYASATGTAITVAANACMFEDFNLVNAAPSTPSTGAGIACTSGGVGFRFRNLSVSGFYRNIDMNNGFEWYINNCVLYDFVKSGLRIANATLPDAGDIGISNCQIIAGPTYNASWGVEWNSAGGVRMTNSKINKRGSGTFSLGVFLNPSDGISTSVFVFNGNSFENMAYGIYCDDTGHTGSGNISKITITGNEFATTAGGKVIAFARAASGHVSELVIEGNDLGSSSSVGGIQLSNIDNVVIGKNTYSPNIVTNAGKLTLGSNVTNLRTGLNVINATTVGTAVLNGATGVVVTTSAVTANSIIQLTQQVPGGTQSGIAYVVSRVVGTSFTIASVALDTSTVGWTIIEPLTAGA